MAPLIPAPVDSTEALGVSQTVESVVGSGEPVRAGPATDGAFAAMKGGEQLDHFTIERETGRGGMGVVYLAHDRALDRRVAIKVVVPRRDDALALDRFFREARAQAKLASPHVVAIHFIGRAGPAAYFAMEHVQGEPLELTLDRGERLEADRGRRLMIEVARGLASAHAVGFIHRDIKPSNLLLDPTGHVKIADFGLARPIESNGATLTGEGVVLGTPMYMAPEQTRGEKVDHRADMYALGCTFFHLVAGVPPYDGANHIELLSKHFTAPVPDLRAKAREATPALARIVARLMAKDAAERYASYVELIAALEAAAVGVVEPAGFSIRGAAAAIDLGLCAALVGITGPYGLIGGFVVIVALQAWRGQTPGKYLLRIRAEQLSGKPLGAWRALARVTFSAWLPLLVAAVVLATKGQHDLFAIVGTASQVGEMKALVTAFAVGNGALSILYAACLGLAAIHPEKRAVHDLLAGSHVVHVRSSGPGIPL